jgi:hypothetical protein
MDYIEESILFIIKSKKFTRMLKINFNLVVSVLLLIVVTGCKSGDSANPVTSYYFYPPVAKGLWITPESSPDPIGQWRSPTGTIYPYPNPFNGSQNIPFTVKQSNSTVKVTIVRALSPFDNTDLTETVNGATIMTGYRKPVWEYEYFNLSPGVHEINWTTSSSQSSFYRIYIVIEGKLEFADVYNAVTYKDWLMIRGQ